MKLDIFIIDYNTSVAETGRGFEDGGELWKIITHVATGLKFIHDLEIVHFDIKPENVFLARNGLYKIGDFGLASHLKNNYNDNLVLVVLLLVLPHNY